MEKLKITFSPILKNLLVVAFCNITFHAFCQSFVTPPLTVASGDNGCPGGASPPGNGYVCLQINTWGIPPYSYLWSTGDTSSTNNTTHSCISNLVMGTYSVTITDSAGNDTLISRTIGSTPNVTNVSMIAPPILGVNTGVYQLTSTLTFNWYPYPDATNINGPVNSSIYNNGPFNNPVYADMLSAGSYSVTTSNATCMFSISTFNLVEYPVQNIISSISIQPACNGANNGGAIANFIYPAGVSLGDSQNGGVGGITYYTQGNYGDVYNFLRMEISDSANNVIACHAMNNTIFSGLAPGNYTLNVIPIKFEDGVIPCSSVSLGNSQITIPFNIPNSIICGNASGKVFFDENSDCSFNNNDVEMPYTILKFNPGNLYAVTDSAGNYNVALDLNNYTVQQANINSALTQLCPDSNFIAHIDTVGETDLINIADSINSQINLRLTLFQSGSFQPNSSVSVFGGVFNTSPYATLPTIFILNYDSNLSVLSVSPPPDISQTGSLTWNIDTLKGFKNFGIGVQLLIPSTDTIGTLHCLSGNILPVLNETDSADNTGTYCFTVQPPPTSYDPNNIVVDPKGFAPAGFIANTEDLNYTVQFQNTGNAPALYVEIIDTLPVSLNLLTIEPLLASHPFTIQLFYPNILKFIFDNIFLPDSSADEFHSHGLIQFKVKQIPNNAAGTIIANSASIIFDSNTPVQTNTVINTIFDCNNMANVSLNDSIYICKDDSLTGNVTLLFPMQTSWYIDSVLVISGLTISVDTLSGGNHIIEMIASNSTCSQSIIQNILVDEVIKPTFNVNGNLLTSSSTSNNQWYLSGNIITGATQNIYTVQQSGWYMVSVSDSFGCIAFSDSVYVSPVGIQELNSELQFSLNPTLITKQQLQIFYSLPQNKSGTFQIFDITGKVVFKYTLPPWSNEQSFKLPKLSDGVYNCVVTSGMERVSRKIAVIKE